MKKYPSLFFFFLWLLFNGTTVYAQSDVQHLSFHFDQNQLTITKTGVYDLVHYGKLENTFEPGFPQLPVKIVSVSVPADKEIENVKIKHLKSEYLDGKYLLFPVQPPQSLSDQQLRPFVSPNKEIYESRRAFPQKIVSIAKGGDFSGYHIESVLIYPLQYFPQQKKVKFFNSIEIEVTLKERRQKNTLTLSRKLSSRKILEGAVKSITQNEVPALSFSKSSSSINTSPKNEYIIITSDAFASHFQPLAHWKKKKGLSATIITTSYIYAHFDGRDNAEKIRNFIIDAYRNRGTMWVLLGGDTNVLPFRSAFAMDCAYGIPNENNIPCDLYFSDLDGDWDANGNGIFGEVDDNIDMYPDVFVGRVSLNTPAKVDNYVKKLLSYEKKPFDLHTLDMLFLAEVLWKNPYTDSGDSKNYIDENFVPQRFDPIRKLYQSLGNEDKNAALKELNRGPNLVNHDGHCWYTGMSVGDGFINGYNMYTLRNGPRYSILYSIGCWPAAFDYPCVAEEYIAAPGGGGVAFIGNSRYGWGNPGDPVYGYSDRFDQQFYKHLFNDNLYHLGNALAAAKAVYVPFASAENVYRWCEYEINLLGDPEMPVWLDNHKTLAAVFPRELPLGESYCPVTVLDDGQPVENALVCLMQENGIYKTANTAADGTVNIYLNTTNPSEDIQITVTAQNYIPFENTIALTSPHSYVQITTHTLNGSTEDFVSPGEEVKIGACFKNYGHEDALNVLASLSTSDSSASIIDGQQKIDRIPAGDSVTVADAYTIKISDAVQNGKVIELTSEIVDSAAQIAYKIFGVTVKTPELVYDSYQISDAVLGDGDGFAEAGEKVNLSINLGNSGLDTAKNCSAIVSTKSPYLSFSDAFCDYGTILPSGQKTATLEMTIQPDCPQPYFPQINLTLNAEPQYQFPDSFLITIGETGFADDMEDGTDNWTHEGDVDLWHLSSYRKHSENFSWYCGKEQEHRYEKNMASNSLVTKPFINDQNSALHYWLWGEFPTYGTTGIYVEINDGSGWEKLDFSGSGGALGALAFTSGWAEYSCDLSAYPAGAELTLRFRFVSDNRSPAEGVYIDDVRIYNAANQPAETEIVAHTAENTGIIKKKFSLEQNYPNPFNPSTQIAFFAEKPLPAKFEIYSISGALVRTISIGTAKRGLNKIIWDGKNNNGLSVSSGIYFYHLTMGKYQDTKRMLLIR